MKRPARQRLWDEILRIEQDLDEAVVDALRTEVAICVIDWKAAWVGCEPCVFDSSPFDHTCHPDANKLFPGYPPAF